MSDEPRERITNGQYRRAAVEKARTQPNAIEIEPYGTLGKTFGGAYVSVIVWVTDEEAERQP